MVLAGSVPAGAWLPPAPPAKSCKENSEKRLYIECLIERLGRQVSALGLLNVVEQLLFSLFSSTLTLDFDIILGSI